MLTAKEYLKIKRDMCRTHKGCVTCAFYGVCNVAANMSDSEIDKLLKRIGGAKNDR